MAKINSTKEEKFRNSLKSWCDRETRPFIREKEDKVRDSFDYDRKHKNIRKMQEACAKLTGDDPNKIQIYSSRGLISQMGPIKDWTPIRKEEE